MPMAISTSALPETLVTSLITHGEDKVDVSACLHHLYVPHARYSRLFGRKLRCLGKGVMLRAGRATTCYLRKVTLGVQAIAIVSKIWNIWDGFHKELYLYGHPLHLRPLQGLCVPSIIGIFNTSEGLANMAMEPPHPHAWRVADRWLSTDEKRAVVEAYTQIHARGVLHRDVALRHMLIGRDGKATIINFRRASCLPPAIKIGLSGCSTYEFQLEMRQVKFLLDFQDARETEYRLAREPRYGTLLNPREGVTTPLPISETTLRQWDASTLEDLRAPTLPFYVPNAPDISMHPVSWIAIDRPLGVDDLLHNNPVEEEPHISTSSEIASSQGHSAQVDSDDIQSSHSLSHPHSAMKRKRLEYDGSSDVECSLAYKRPCLESSITSIADRFPDAHLISMSEREQPVASTSLITSQLPLEPLPSFVASASSYPAAISLDITRSAEPSSNDAFLPNQLSTSSLSCRDTNAFSSSSWVSTSLAVPSHIPAPGYASYIPHPSCPEVEEPEAHYQFPPQLDYTSDSSSDDSFSSADTSDRSWDDSLSLFPRGAHEMLQVETPSFRASGYIYIVDPSLEGDIKSTGACRLSGLNPSFKTGKPIAVQHKRKLLFLTDEDDEYEARASKKRGIER